jgi:hypothetical protein
MGDDEVDWDDEWCGLGVNRWEATLWMMSFPLRCNDAHRHLLGGDWSYDEWRAKHFAAWMQRSESNSIQLARSHSSPRLPSPLAPACSGPSHTLAVISCCRGIGSMICSCPVT